MQGRLRRVETLPPDDSAIRIVVGRGEGLFLDPEDVSAFLGGEVAELSWLEFRTTFGSVVTVEVRPTHRTEPGPVPPPRSARGEAFAAPRGQQVRASAAPAREPPRARILPAEGGRSGAPAPAAGGRHDQGGSR